MSELANECQIFIDKIALAVVVFIVLMSASLLAYVSNKGASYLMKVPSSLFAIVACPVLLVTGFSAVACIEE